MAELTDKSITTPGENYIIIVGVQGANSINSSNYLNVL